LILFDFDFDKNLLCDGKSIAAMRLCVNLKDLTTYWAELQSKILMGAADLAGRMSVSDIGCYDNRKGDLRAQLSRPV